MAIYWWLYIHIDIHIHTYIHLLHFVYVLMPRFVSCRPNCIIQFLIRQVSYIISFLVIEWFSSNNATVKMKQWKLHDLSKMKVFQLQYVWNISYRDFLQQCNRDSFLIILWFRQYQNIINVIFTYFSAFYASCETKIMYFRKYFSFHLRTLRCQMHIPLEVNTKSNIHNVMV